MFPAGDLLCSGDRTLYILQQMPRACCQLSLTLGQSHRFTHGFAHDRECHPLCQFATAAMRTNTPNSKNPCCQSKAMSLISKRANTNLLNRVTVARVSALIRRSSPCNVYVGSGSRTASGALLLDGADCQ